MAAAFNLPRTPGSRANNPIINVPTFSPRIDYNKLPQIYENEDSDSSSDSSIDEYFDNDKCDSFFHTLKKWLDYLLHKKRSLCLIPIIIAIFLWNLHGKISLSDRIFEKILSKQLAFTKGSLLDTEMSKANALNINLMIFNCTNYLDVDFGAKPVFEEVGPYVYTFTSRNVNTTFNGTSHSVTYKRLLQIDFNRTATDPSLNPDIDMVYHANVPAILYANLRHQYEDMIPWVAEPIIKVAEQQLDSLYVLTNNTVGGLLHGYEDSMVKSIKTMASTMIDYLGDSENEKDVFRKQIEKYLPDNLGILNFVNNTITPPTTVNDGTVNIRDVMKIISSNGETSLPCWKFDNITGRMDYEIEANKVMTELQASDGIFYPPLTSKMFPPKHFPVYSPEQFRIVNVTYAGKEEIAKLPVLVYKYDNDTINSDNNALLASLCSHQPNNSTHPEHCKFSKGTVLINRCLAQAGFIPPILLSNPHLYGATGELLNHIDGFNPDWDQHGNYVKFEPTTGVPIELAKRLQVNIMARKTDVVYNDYYEDPRFSRLGENYTDWDHILLPIVYIDMFRKDEKTATMFYNTIHKAGFFIDNWAVFILFWPAVLVLIGVFYKERLEILHGVDDGFISNKKINKTLRAERKPILNDISGENSNSDTIINQQVNNKSLRQRTNPSIQIKTPVPVIPERTSDDVYEAMERQAQFNQKNQASFRNLPKRTRPTNLNFNYIDIKGRTRLAMTSPAINTYNKNNHNSTGNIHRNSPSAMSAISAAAQAIGTPMSEVAHEVAESFTNIRNAVTDAVLNRNAGGSRRELAEDSKMLIEKDKDSEESEGTVLARNDQESRSRESQSSRGDYSNKVQRRRSNSGGDTFQSRN